VATASEKRNCGAPAGAWVEYVDRRVSNSAHLSTISPLNINDMYNNDVCKGGTQGCETYEVK
jgi:hypothetical protein